MLSVLNQQTYCTVWGAQSLGISTQLCPTMFVHLRLRPCLSDSTPWNRDLYDYWTMTWRLFLQNLISYSSYIFPLTGLRLDRYPLPVHGSTVHAPLACTTNECSLTMGYPSHGCETHFPQVHSKCHRLRYSFWDFHEIWIFCKYLAATSLRPHWNIGE